MPTAERPGGRAGLGLGEPPCMDSCHDHGQRRRLGRVSSTGCGAGRTSRQNSAFTPRAGMTGRRLCKLLVRQGVPINAFIDVDEHKIGRTKRGFPVVSPDRIPELWGASQNPALLSAVSARVAKPLIRDYLLNLDLTEGEDFWMAA